MNANFWTIAQNMDDEIFQEDTDKQYQRAKQILELYDDVRLKQLKEQVSQAFKQDNDSSWTGLDFYYHLEKCTGTFLFHNILREGKRNQHRNGLQQSYGDHTRLLLLGIDKVASANYDWFMTRQVDPKQVTEDDLNHCFSEYANLKVSSRELFLIWLSAALHDYGKLFGESYGPDPENGLALAQPIIDILCEPEERGFVIFGIRNHDVIEYVPSGETPPAFISEQLLQLPYVYRRLGMITLGMIQFAGAASLGEGRLTARRVKTFLYCVNNIMLNDLSPETRLARLILGDTFSVPEEQKNYYANIIQSMGETERTSLLALLSKAILYDWPGIRNAVRNKYADAELCKSLLLRVLNQVSSLWSKDYGDHTHVAFSDELKKGFYGLLEHENHEQLQFLSNSVKQQSIRLLSGSHLLHLG